MLQALFSWNFCICLVSSCIVSIAFSVMFRVRARYFLWTGLGGGITYIVYFLINCTELSVFFAAFFSALFCALFAEVMARVLHTPAVVFLLPCAIPIVPGGDLYYTMIHLLSRNFGEAWSFLFKTLSVGVGIAGGIVVISILFHLFSSIRIRVGKKA